MARLGEVGINAPELELAPECGATSENTAKPAQKWPLNAWCSPGTLELSAQRSESIHSGGANCPQIPGGLCTDSVADTSSWGASAFVPLGVVFSIAGRNMPAACYKRVVSSSGLPARQTRQD